MGLYAFVNRRKRAKARSERLHDHQNHDPDHEDGGDFIDDPVKALNILRGNGHAVKETDVLAVECPDHPGGVNAVLKPLKNANINVLYL